MKRLWIVLFGVIVFIVTGCLRNDDQIINVFKLNETKNVHEVYIVIEEKEKVKSISKILENASWEKGEIDIARKPDYQFGFALKDSNKSDKSAYYSIWLNPDMTSAIVVQEASQIAHLKQKQTETIVKTIANESYN